MNALSGSESSAASARLPALLEDIEMRGYSADMVAAAEDAVALARMTPDPAILATALYCGLKVNHSAGNWRLAIMLGEEAVSVYARNGDRLGEYKARYSVGLSLWRDGQLTEAFIAYEQASVIARGLRDVERQVRSLNMKAYLLGTLRDYAAAVVAFDQALALCGDDLYEFDRLLVLNNKAQMLINRARASTDPVECVEYAQAARDLLSNEMVERAEGRWGLGARDTLGQCLVLLGLSQQALGIFQENLHRAERAEEPIGRAQASMGLAEALLDLGQPELALRSCESLRGSEGVRLWPSLLPRVDNTMAQALYALGRHEEAYKAFGRYNERVTLLNTRIALQYTKYIEIVIQLETSRAETEAYKKLAHELTVAKLAAEEASRAKSEFLSNMSHELKTPLNAIIGFTEIMASEMFGAVSPRYREYLNDIHSSGTHLLGLVNQLLDLANAEAGTVELAEENVHINDVLDEVATRLAEVAAARGVNFIWSLCAGAVVRGDRLRLAQCLLNVLSNVLDVATSPGEVNLATRIGQGGLTVELSTSGAKLRADEVPKVFERFGQGGSSRTGTTSGYGLPLAKRLIELHGGTAELISDPALGTIIRLRFPKERLALGTA